MRYNLRKRVRELSTFRAKSPSSFQSKEVKSFSWNSVYIYHYGSFIVFPIRAVPRVFLYAQCILYLISIIVTIFDHIPDNLIGYLSSVYIYYQDVVFYFLNSHFDLHASDRQYYLSKFNRVPTQHHITE